MFGKTRDVGADFRRWRFMLWVVVCLIAGLYGWQMVRIFSGGEMSSQGEGEVEGMPTKYHTDRDVVSKKGRGDADPIGSYVERAKRGMTEKEVLRLLDEFDAIGFMPTSGDVEESRLYAEKMNDWYSRALVEGLSLNAEQSAQVRAFLKENLDERIEIFSKGKKVGKDAGIFIEISFEGSFVYRSAKMAPWELADLSEDQVKLTTKKIWEEQQEEGLNLIEGMVNANSAFPWLDYNSLTMQNPLTGESESYPPPSLIDKMCQMPGTIKGGIIDISDAFPLTPDQKLAEHRLDIAAQTRMLHPSQLRMALLLNPHLSQAIRKGLDGDS